MDFSPTSNFSLNLITGTSTITGSFSSLLVNGQPTRNIPFATFERYRDADLYPAASSTNYYFTGPRATTFTLAGNFNDAASSGNVQGSSPSSTSDVFIGSTLPVPAHLRQLWAPITLGINSLSFTSSGAGTSLNGTGTLTLSAS